MSREIIITSYYFSLEEELLLRALLSIIQNKISFSYSYKSDLNIDDCSIAIININNEQGRYLWNRYHKEKKPVVIAYTENPAKVPEYTSFLTKPLRSDNLKETLEKVFRQHEAEANSNNTSIQLKKLNNIKKSYATGKNKIHQKNAFADCLLELILKNHTGPLLIKGKNPIIIEAEKLRYYGILSELDMENLLLTGNHLLDVEEILPYQMAEYTSNMMSSELSVSLWKIILTHSKGTLLQGLHNSYFFKLKRWPNLKKLYHNHKHMKLTVYLSRYGGDIKTLADTSRIPVSDVINYINACHVLRYLEINTGPGETDSKVRKYGTYTGNQTDPDKVSLFKKIRDRLGI